MMDVATIMTQTCHSNAVKKDHMLYVGGELASVRTDSPVLVYVSRQQYNT
jgi:hypothetical protein